MRKTKPLTNAAGEVRELGAADFKRMRPASEVLSPEFLKNWKRGSHTIVEETEAEHEARKGRGAQKSPTKELISIRLSPDVLTRFRASGTGWQGRVDAALRQWLKRHSPDRDV